jgi:hypothetical protein
LLEVPDFGDRFRIYALYDARTDEFTQIGQQYKTKPGFYLIVGPNWKGEPHRFARHFARTAAICSASCRGMGCMADAP